jgi:hypothetical protein
MLKKITLLFLSFMVFVTCFAQNTTSGNSKPQSIVLSSGIEGSILQFANFTNDSKSVTTIPRYTFFLNGGIHANYKISNTFRAFTGLDFKNIGLIDKYRDTLKKRRMYAIGAPLGLKIKIKQKLKLKIGADFSLVFNYKEKVFVNGDKKSKFNEFFSDKTPLFYPSIFAGIIIDKISLSANYYPNNFFNSDYKFYSKMEAKLFTISVGVHLDNHSNKKSKTK